MVDIRFGDLRIDQISGNSGVFAGDNQIIGFRSTSKHNQAFGMATGERSLFTVIRAVVRDRDRMDMQTVGRQEEP